MRKKLHSVDWSKVQESHNQGVFWNDLPRMFGFSRSLLNNALRNGFLVKHHYKRTCSDETKQLMRTIKIEYFKNNPDKHPWKKSTKFKSEPCEKFKRYLRDNGIEFAEEFQPLEDRFFNIDISFPKDKIGIEINGNQHYDKNGNLKEYYQERHKLIEDDGWNLYEIHYSKVYDEEFLKDFLDKLITSSLEKIDYSVYIKQKKPKKKCTDCGANIFQTSIRCKKCTDVLPHKRKFEISKEELETLIKEKPYTEIGKIFGVSDNAVKKRAKLLGIGLEVRLGYWAKFNKESKNQNELLYLDSSNCILIHSPSIPDSQG